jgi:hypothetical protein
MQTFFYFFLTDSRRIKSRFTSVHYISRLLVDDGEDTLMVQAFAESSLVASGESFPFLSYPVLL